MCYSEEERRERVVWGGRRVCFKDEAAIYIQCWNCHLKLRDGLNSLLARPHNIRPFRISIQVALHVFFSPNVPRFPISPRLGARLISRGKLTGLGNPGGVVVIHNVLMELLHRALLPLWMLLEMKGREQKNQALRHTAWAATDSVY